MAGSNAGYPFYRTAHQFWDCKSKGKVKNKKEKIIWFLSIEAIWKLARSNVYLILFYLLIIFVSFYEKDTIVLIGSHGYCKIKDSVCIVACTNVQIILD